MIKTFLKDNKFYAIQPTVYLKNVTLKKWSEDAHVRVDFESTALQRCDVHGTLRLDKDSKDLWKTPDREAVGRALWVYSNKSYRSPQSLAWWLKNGNVTYDQLKSNCKELSAMLREWEYEIGRVGCEILEHNSVANSHPISCIGVSDT